MKLGALAEAAGIRLAGGADCNVTGFAIDNRKVAPGTVFGAFQGAAVNGEDFIPAAVQAGAVAIVARPEASVAGAIHIADAAPRRAFARLAAQFFSPVPETIAAITGTNGKTSIAELTRQLWRMAGHHAASIGTLGVTTADGSIATGLTTPDIVTFLANMAGLAREGVTHVAYEASSHGLSQFRNDGLRVRAGAFTNLSRDHLDYHKDMADYFAAKMRLFDEVVEPGGTAVVGGGNRAGAHARAAPGDGGRKWRGDPSAGAHAQPVGTGARNRTRRRPAHDQPAADRGLSGGQWAGVSGVGYSLRAGSRCGARYARKVAAGARAA